MKKFIVAAITLATAFVTSLAAHGQDAPLDPDTGLPVLRPFDFPAQGPAAPFWAKRLTGYFTTADGVRLRYSVLLPKASGRFPCGMSVRHGPGGVPAPGFITPLRVSMRTQAFLDAGNE